MCMSTTCPNNKSGIGADFLCNCKSKKEQITNTSWRKAKDPPKTKTGCWSKDVIVVTNYRDVFSLAYFGDKDEGCWQRPERFNKDEKVKWWIEKPEVN